MCIHIFPTSSLGLVGLITYLFCVILTIVYCYFYIIMNKNKSYIDPIYFAFMLNHGNTTTKWNILNKVHEQIHNNTIL